MRKRASFYKGNKFYIIHSSSKVINGFNIATEPYFKLDITSPLSDVVRKLLEAMRASKEGLPNPTNWNEFQKEYLKNIGLRSHKDLYKGYIFCDIFEENEKILITPTVNKGIDGGFSYLPDKTVQISSNKSIDEICDALKKAIDACE